MALTVFDKGVDSGIEMADLGEPVYKRPHGERDDVSLWMGQGVKCEKESGVHRVVEKDEFVKVILVGGCEVDIFTGYALKEIEGVAQEEMLWKAGSCLLRSE